MSVQLSVCMSDLERFRGGYVPHIDHSCPPDISYDNYCYYLRRLGEVGQGL